MQYPAGTIMFHCAISDDEAIAEAKEYCRRMGLLMCDASIKRDDTGVSVVLKRPVLIFPNTETKQ
jgi:hypothetical protein